MSLFFYSENVSLSTLPYDAFPSEAFQFSPFVFYRFAIVFSQIAFSKFFCMIGSLCPSFRSSGIGYSFDSFSAFCVGYCFVLQSGSLDGVGFWCLGIGFLTFSSLMTGEASFLGCRLWNGIVFICAAVAWV